MSNDPRVVDWKPQGGLKRLKLLASQVGMVGLVDRGWWVAIWEAAAAVHLDRSVDHASTHLFIAEIRAPGAVLAPPEFGVRRVGANFVALTAIVASLQRVSDRSVTGICDRSGWLGSLAFYIRIFGKLTLPTITLLAPIAPVAWIPFALVAFGIGNGAAVFVVFIGIIFTLTLGTVNHMEHVDQVYINTARVLGASRRQVMQHVILPAILPNLFVIMRLNLFGAWTGVLAAEMVGVNTGLGTIVMVGRSMMNMNLTFLGMAIIGLVGYLLDAGFGLIQNRVLWWKSTAQV